MSISYKRLYALVSCWMPLALMSSSNGLFNGKVGQGRGSSEPRQEVPGRSQARVWLIQKRRKRSDFQSTYMMCKRAFGAMRGKG